jgi:hypothetical protein
LEIGVGARPAVPITVTGFPNMSPDYALASIVPVLKCALLNQYFPLFVNKYFPVRKIPELVSRAAYVKQYLRDKLLDYKNYISTYGEDLPEIHNWNWGSGAIGNRSAE